MSYKLKSAATFNLTLLAVLFGLGMFAHGAFFLVAAVFVMILPACSTNN
jgi:hypothetical protein